jgi:predicted dehydrogenase
VARAFGVHCVELPEDPAGLPPADLVLLAIPYGARWGYYDALARREMALFIEKPLFRTVEQHEQLCSVWPAHRVAHGYQRRSLGTLRLARELVDSRVFGPLESVDFGMGNPGIVTFGRYYGNLELAGGGVLFETGVHGIDALMHLTRATEASVREVEMIVEEGSDLHTDARISLQTAAGDAVNATLSTSALRETTNRIELVFAQARVRFSIFDASGAIRVRPRGGGGEFELAPADPRGFPRTENQTLHAHWTAVLDALREERPNATSAHDALLTTRIVEQCYTQAERRQGAS